MRVSVFVWLDTSTPATSYVQHARIIARHARTLHHALPAMRPETLH